MVRLGSRSVRDWGCGLGREDSRRECGKLRLGLRFRVGGAFRVEMAVGVRLGLGVRGRVRVGG